jgi:hypothetical protein
MALGHRTFRPRSETVPNPEYRFDTTLSEKLASRFKPQQSPSSRATRPNGRYLISIKMLGLFVCHRLMGSQQDQRLRVLEACATGRSG